MDVVSLGEFTSYRWIRRERKGDESSYLVKFFQRASPTCSTIFLYPLDSAKTTISSRSCNFPVALLKISPRRRLFSTLVLLRLQSLRMKTDCVSIVVKAIDYICLSVCVCVCVCVCVWITRVVVGWEASYRALLSCPSCRTPSFQAYVPSYPPLSDHREIPPETRKMSRKLISHGNRSRDFSLPIVRRRVETNCKVPANGRKFCNYTGDEKTVLMLWNYTRMKTRSSFARETFTARFNDYTARRESHTRNRINNTGSVYRW